MMDYAFRLCVFLCGPRWFACVCVCASVCVLCGFLFFFSFIVDLYRVFFYCKITLSVFNPLCAHAVLFFPCGMFFSQGAGLYVVIFHSDSNSLWSDNRCSFILQWQRNQTLSYFVAAPLFISLLVCCSIVFFFLSFNVFLYSLHSFVCSFFISLWLLFTKLTLLQYMIFTLHSMISCASVVFERLSKVVRLFLWGQVSLWKLLQTPRWRESESERETFRLFVLVSFLWP